MALKNIKPLRLKTKNYQQVAVIEIILIFFILIMGDVATALNEAYADKIVTGVLLVLEIFYLLLLVQLAGFLSPNKRIINLLKLAVGTIFLLSFIALNPFFTIVSDLKPWLIAVHLILCSVECFVIALGLMDIYSDNLRITERLWGSVAVYLLIALGWGSFYEIFVLIDPMSLGVTLTAGYQTYSESLYFSLCSISGSSSAYTNPSHLIRNLSLVESVWGVLFLVMLIGGLFTLPSPNRD